MILRLLYILLPISICNQALIFISHQKKEKNQTTHLLSLFLCVRVSLTICQSCSSSVLGWWFQEIPAFWLQIYSAEDTTDRSMCALKVVYHGVRVLCIYIIEIEALQILPLASISLMSRRKEVPFVAQLTYLLQSSKTRWFDYQFLYNHYTRCAPSSPRHI